MRFLARPFQVAYILPSSRSVVRKVASKMDFSKPRTIVEFGPGEGCHTREIVQRMHPDSKLILFELDPELASHMEDQFADDRRVEVLNTDAARIREELTKRGIDYCDYVVSGIPFSVIDVDKKRSILNAVYQSLAPDSHSALVVYQCTNELKQHATMFPRTESHYFVPNIPPMIVTAYYKSAKEGHSQTSGACGCNGHHGPEHRHHSNRAKPASR